MRRRDFLTLLLGGCASGVIASRLEFAQGTPAAASQIFGPWGFDLSGRDLATKPGDDFFRHANGAWFDRTVIASDQRSGGVDRILIDDAETHVRAILERGAQGIDPSARADAEKIGAFYASFMDEARAEALDAKPIAPLLQMIQAAKSRADLAALMTKPLFGGRSAARSQEHGGGSIFSHGIDIDAKAPGKYAVMIFQGGLGLPNRDYYLTAQFAAEKAAYLAYVARLLGMIGWQSPQQSASAIVDLETAIAKASWPLSDSQDSDKTYNPMSEAELTRLAPFPWRSFLRGAGLGELGHIIVAENTAIPRIAALYESASINTLRARAAFHLVDTAAPYLSKRFVAARFEFREKTIKGVADLPARWKRGVRLLNDHMGEAVGRLYVAQHFPPEARAQVDDLVKQIRRAFQVRIEAVTWMSAETKAKALDKLARFNVKIAHPDKWRDYSKLPVRPDDLVGNVIAGEEFEWTRNVARLTSPVDRDEWYMNAQDVNAYYSSNLNEIVLPAAQLQAPYFDVKADPAVNYGGIGTLIGHELTHGFDDDGRKYDGAGVLSSWWSDADVREFTERADELGKQYNAFEPLPGVHVNGELTMGENIADLGGTLIAYDAYRRSLAGKPAPVLDGLSGDRRFFLAYAQSYRTKRREESLRQQIVSDPHAPEQYRVNGVVRNMDAWYAAFDVKPDDKLYLAPDRRVRIW